MGIENKLSMNVEKSFEIFKINEDTYIEKIKNIKNIEELEKQYIDLILLQKENKLGIFGKNHEEQSEDVLINGNYWSLQNLLRLIEIKKEILKNGFERYSSFSVGGSIGAGYLGFLLKREEIGETPEVIFGSSAGSLFPTLYLLWQKAKKVNPQKAGNFFEGIAKIFPDKLEGKSMWSNGEELIEKFKDSAQYLINIINEKVEKNDKLSDINSLKIKEISPTLGIIASRKKGNRDFQEVIFSGNDNLMNAIIASSNFELNILGMNYSVLTDKKNKFYSNIWHDGFHTNPNPLEYASILGTKNYIEYSTFKFLAKSFSGNENNDEHKHGLVLNLTYFMKRDYSGGEENYSENDQNISWDKESMMFKVILETSEIYIKKYKKKGFFIKITFFGSKISFFNRIMSIFGDYSQL